MNPTDSITYANADAPIAITATQTALFAIGVLLLVVGVRAGTVRYGTARWMRRENINLPVVWVGVTIFGVGTVLSIAAGIIWFSWFRLIAAILTAGATVFIAWAIRRLQNDITSGVINDYADELADDEDDEDDEDEPQARIHNGHTPGETP